MKKKNNPTLSCEKHIPSINANASKLNAKTFLSYAMNIVIYSNRNDQFVGFGGV